MEVEIEPRARSEPSAPGSRALPCARRSEDVPKEEERHSIVSHNGARQDTGSAAGRDPGRHL